jgi:TRAP transporter 4TM/12TM fusion protein
LAGRLGWYYCEEILPMQACMGNREAEALTGEKLQAHPTDRGIANLLAFCFTIVILIYAASSPLSELVRWVVEATTAGFDEMSRRDQRLALRSHWLGAGFRSFERGVLLPTGMILGLPIIFSFVIALLTLHKAPRLRLLNWGLAAVATMILLTWIANLFAIDGGILPVAKPLDFALFPIATALTLYLTWRFYGGFIVGFCLFWIIYFFIRGDLPVWTGIFAGSESTYAQSLRSMVLNFWSQTGGMFGQPLQVVSGNVLIFIVFGAVLMASGAGDLLMKIANRLTGGLTGGAAHAAVASSALFGTLSGAAISNVVSTGVMTIPVIKKSGFKPAFAGAVEAAASTGGQIMPPVMGVVAFFVAGQIGLEYRYIVVAAIIPAAFYYLGTFLTVYFEARRQGIGTLPIEERPPLNGQERLQCLVFIVPVTTLTYFLFAQPSVLKAGFYGFLAALVCALILFKPFRNWKRIYSAFVQAGHMSAQIIIIVAAIGLIVGLIQVSGFSGRLSLLLAQLADGPLFTTLIIVALGSIVLGMGLPPGATYFIIVIALSSGIDAVSIPSLTLHLFVVFFAVISTVTPPVALAAFAAAPIAGADPMRTGFQAARLSLAGFIIPFVFVYHPAVLYKLQVLFEWFGDGAANSRAMIDASAVAWSDLAWILTAFCLAMWLLTSALAGFEKYRLNLVERLLRSVVGIALLVPNWQIAGPAFAAALALIAFSRISGQRAAAAPDASSNQPTHM